MFARVRKSKVDLCSSWDMLNCNNMGLEQSKIAEVLEEGNRNKNSAAESLKEKDNVVNDVLKCLDSASDQQTAPPAPPSPSFGRVFAATIFDRNSNVDLFLSLNSYNNNAGVLQEKEYDENSAAKVAKYQENVVDDSVEEAVDDYDALKCQSQASVQLTPPPLSPGCVSVPEVPPKSPRIEFGDEDQASTSSQPGGYQNHPTSQGDNPKQSVDELNIFGDEDRFRCLRESRQGQGSED